VLIDPIDPPRGLRKPDHVLLTVFWHGRSTAELKPKRVWAQSRSAQPLRFCPERWLGKGTHDDLRETLEPLLALPVQRVLVSHGEPVLRAGKAALAQVLS